MTFDNFIEKLTEITKVVPDEKQLKTIQHYVEIFIHNYPYQRPGYRLYTYSVCANNILITLGLNPQWKDKEIFPKAHTVELLQTYNNEHTEL